MGRPDNRPGTAQAPFPVQGKRAQGVPFPPGSSGIQGTLRAASSLEIPPPMTRHRRKSSHRHGKNLLLNP